MEANTKEYEMLRQEITQYLKEYQNVRNMMYIITVTLLGFCLKEKITIVYIYLLPLIVIIPSYLVYIDYYNAIVRDAAYLIVFYESNDSFPIKWESRLRKYAKIVKSKGSYRKFPYVVCFLVSLILYLFKSKSNVFNILLGILIFVVCICVFLTNKEMKYNKAIEKWQEVKKIEDKL